MASTNSIKIYAPDSFYHLYNRGAEKKDIFRDNQDFAVFLSYLKTYLLPKDISSLNSILASQNASSKEKEHASRLLKLNNFSDTMELHAFALLPNHFHLLIKQTDENSIDKFMNSIGTRYTQYFNKKYGRIGKLYQEVYKAVLIETDEQLLHLSRYIHLNPFKWLNIPPSQLHKITLPSSLQDYLGTRNSTWIRTNQILSYFKKTDPRADYFNFLKVYVDPEIVAEVAIDYTDD